MIWFLLVFSVLLVAAIIVEHKNKVKMQKMGVDWKLVDPTKKGGSYSIYFMDKHIANVRGKMKALVLIHAIKGMDITDKLDMKLSKTDTKVMKKVMAKKKVVKKAVKKVVKKAKPMAKKKAVKM